MIKETEEAPLGYYKVMLKDYNIKQSLRQLPAAVFSVILILHLPLQG